MNYLVLADEKPTKCEECPFYGDLLNRLEKNKFNLEKRCVLINGSYEDCPLTIVNTVFVPPQKIKETEA